MATTPISALPIASGIYLLDRNRSGVFFEIRHFGFSKVRGVFTSFEARLDVGQALDSVALYATIDTASVDTNNPKRDAHLRSSDLLDAEAHPLMSFRSTRIHPIDHNGFVLEGDLTINGITKPVALDVDFNGGKVDPDDGRVHAGFSATAEIRLADFEVGLILPLGIGKLTMGDKVKLDVGKFTMGDKVKLDIDAQFLAH
jgi:polyisoprenoid-binding protein YceI